MSADKQRTHYQQCAKTVFTGVSEVAHKAKASSVILFSDIHTGRTGAAEFDKMWLRTPLLNQSRKEAVQRLHGAGWLNGDEMVVKYMAEHVLVPERWDDQGVLAYLVMQFCTNARLFVTCVEEACRRCNRHLSSFAKRILKFRAKN